MKNLMQITSKYRCAEMSRITYVFCFKNIVRKITGDEATSIRMENVIFSESI